MTLILLGRIMGAHGIRGAVKLKSFTADPAAIATYGPLTTASGQSITIRRIKSAKDEFIADLAGVNDRTAAEALQGADLLTERSRLPPAGEGEIYLADLEGKAVVAEGATLGTITGFQNFGAGELLELESGALIPVAFITSVDAQVVVTLPPGFLDPPAREDQHH